MLSDKIINWLFDEYENLLKDETASIDNIVEKFNELIVSSSQPFMKSYKSKKYVAKTNNAWFDKECLMLKRKRNKLLRVFRKSKTPGNLENYLNSKKVFNRTVFLKKSNLLANKLKTIENTVNDPKVFWKEISRLTKPSETIPNISLDNWFDHFQSLFNDGFETGNQEGVINEDMNCDMNIDELENILFNSEITSDEINHVVNSVNVKKM